MHRSDPEPFCKICTIDDTKSSLIYIKSALARGRYVEEVVRRTVLKYESLNRLLEAKQSMRWGRRARSISAIEEQKKSGFLLEFLVDIHIEAVHAVTR